MCALRTTGRSAAVAQALDGGGASGVWIVSGFWASLRRHRGELLVGGLFLVLPLGLAVSKIARVGYDLGNLLPVEAYDVTLQMQVTGHGDSLWVRTYLPPADSRVRVLDESRRSDLPVHTEQHEDGNRVAAWSGGAVAGDRRIRVRYKAVVQPQRFEIDPSRTIPGPPPSRVDPNLQATESIQLDDAEIGALAARLAPTGTSLVLGLRNIHQYCQELGYVAFKGETSAVTALRLGEASCNGRSRLFAALVRHQGIPCRLVGGLILEPGSKRTSHQWVEVEIGSHWVPFCPTNDHFAAIPSNYLPLYRGDLALFAHSEDVNFDYHFRIGHEFAIRPELADAATRDPFNLLGIWGIFEQAGFPIDLLKSILMIPLGALVVVILRNVVGLTTFGTFLPTLIAVAARDTGLFWGSVAFVTLIGLVHVVRLALLRLQLLHQPQLAILLTFVILFMLGMAVVGARSGNLDLAYVGMFPIAILAITTERFGLMIEEEGPRRTLSVALMTLVAIAACYEVMNALTFQILFMSFPELLLVVIFLDIWLGRWMGLRVLEYWRFRRLIAVRS